MLCLNVPALLELGIHKSSDLELGCNFLEHMIRMEIHKFIRCVLSDVLQQYLATTGVFVEPFCDIIHITLDNDPGRGFY